MKINSCLGEDCVMNKLYVDEKSCQNKENNFGWNYFGSDIFYSLTFNERPQMSNMKIYEIRLDLQLDSTKFLFLYFFSKNWWFAEMRDTFLRPWNRSNRSYCFLIHLIMFNILMPWNMWTGKALSPKFSFRDDPPSISKVSNTNVSTMECQKNHFSKNTT